MELKTLNNKPRKYKKVKKYLIDWDGKSRSKIQLRVKKFLKKYWDQNVVFEEFPVIGTRLTLDFYNANKKVAVEVQGRQHVKYIKFFHKSRIDYINQLKRDEQKEKFCELNDIVLVNIYENDIIDEHLFEIHGVTL